MIKILECKVAKANEMQRPSIPQASNLWTLLFGSKNRFMQQWTS